MGSTLPPLTESQFREEILRASKSSYSSACLTALYLHYTELRRWNASLSLVGPGTAQDALARHYIESLAASPLISSTDRCLVDIGSGAGFPGFVLAATNPSLKVNLVESRERKWAFLKTVVRRSGLSCQCLNVRVERPLSRQIPRRIDVVTCRALTVSPAIFELMEEASPSVRFLLWCGIREPMLPKGFEVAHQISLEGSKHRRIVEILKL